MAKATKKKPAAKKPAPKKAAKPAAKKASPKKASKPAAKKPAPKKASKPSPKKPAPKKAAKPAPKKTVKKFDTWHGFLVARHDQRIVRPKWRGLVGFVQKIIDLEGCITIGKAAQVVQKALG